MNFTMKSTRLLLPMVIFAGLVTADTETESDPQPPMTFTPVAAGTWAADWAGVSGRTYFVQWSTDLVNWYYAPILDYGEGDHSHGMDASSPKFFTRLHYGGWYNSLEEARSADMDGDGLSNLFEVTYGYDPFDPQSTAGGSDNQLDPDEDGMSNTTEQAQGCDPMKKDNPKLMLQVDAY